MEIVIPTLSGTPDFTTFGEFMLSHIHYIYMYIHYIICWSYHYVFGVTFMD